MPRTRRILILSSHVPTPDVDGGALRLVRIMQTLRDLGYALTYIPRLPQSLPPLRHRLAADWQMLRDQGIDAPAVTDPVDYLQKHARDFDLAIFSGFDAAEHLLGIVRKAAPQLITIYDTVDLAHIREGRRALQTGDWVLRMHVLNITRIEFRSLARAHYSWVVSPEEQQIVQRRLPAANVDVIPGVFPIFPPQAPWTQRNGLLFVGNFQHAPNVDAALYLVREVLPSIHAVLPQVNLWIVGGFAPPAVQALQTSHIHVTGQVPDLGAVHEQVRVALAPIRFGAGIKTKVLSSMGYGVPVAMSMVAAEGLPIAHGFNGLVAGDATALAAAVVHVHEDPELWRFVSDQSLATVAQFYSPAALQAALERLLDRCFSTHANA